MYMYALNLGKKSRDHFKMCTCTTRYISNGEKAPRLSVTFQSLQVLALDFNKRKAFDVKVHAHAGYALYTCMDYMYVLPAGELRGDTLCYGLYYVSIVQ